MKYKTCKICDITKPRTEFQRARSPKYEEHWDCRDAYCKPCRKEYMNNRSRLVKKQCVEYLGGKCEKCGLVSNHYEIYDFHHLDPKKKDMNISKRRLCFETLQPELDKCVLYCANCHRIVHYST